MGTRIARLGSWLGLGLLTAGLVALATVWALGWRIDIVESASMAPTIPTGSAAIVAPVSGGQVATGDVIRFRSVDDKGTRLILHRVTEVSEQPDGSVILRTKGDANRTPDPRGVKTEQVDGRLVFHIPRLGTVLRAARPPAGLIVLAGLPLAVGLTIAARERRRTKAVASA